MRKRKTDVYVTVDSPKVAKKLKKVLAMFGEKVYSSSSVDIAFENKWYIHFYQGDWCNNSDFYQGKTKVNVSELKQILFREHAKEGDVVIADCGGDTRYVVDVKSVDDYEAGYINANKYICLRDGATIQTGGAFRKFIRYATEKEKALLNTLNELEVGKWYKREDSSYLAFMTDLKGRGYGFDINGKWFEGGCGFSNCKEATPQEVEAALIKEAKRRYKVGDKLSKVYGDYSKGGRIFSHDLDFVESNSSLWIENDSTEGFAYSSCIFNEGQWAEVVEPVGELVATVKGTDKKYDFILDNNYIKELIGIENVLPKGFEIKISSSSDSIELEGLYKGSLVKMKY